MLIVYRIDTGEIVDNTGTNSRWPEGPPDDLAFVNTDAAGIDRDGLALLRLHDRDDAELVQQALTHQIIVQDGQLVIGYPHPEPDPVEPEPDPVMERLEALEVEVRGIRERAAAANVANADAKAVRDAVAGPRG
ncbi:MULTISPECIES: hypothetical protein [unclassified Egicoccus]|uniref:hypothetical protein n=1 Tax=unclassified Egicoccus TaxID=2635606 RepID=UPI00359E56A2